MRFRSKLFVLAILFSALRLEGAEVRLLEHHADALRARVDAMRAAREQIELSTFIVENDLIGLGIMGELRAAAARGVRVRMLLDAFYNRLDRRVVGHLLDSGIEIREYHPFRPTKPLWITRRLHDKLLLVDGETMILGGRNVSNAYFGIGDKTYTDRDVSIAQSESVASALSYFDALWESEHVAEEMGRYHPRRLAAECRENERPRRLRRCQRQQREVNRGLREGRAQVDDTHARFLDLDLLAAHSTGGSEGGLREPTWRSQLHRIDDAQVRFVHDVIGAKASQPGTSAALRDLFSAARISVVIESPYLVPSRAFRRELEAAHLRGVAVRILTNSLNTTDNLWPQAGYVGEKRWLLGRGVELWEQIGQHTLHSKSAVLDARTSVIGSFNLDPRSQRLNREVLVVVESEALAHELLTDMSAALESAWRIGADGKPLGHEERYPGIGWWKKCKLHLLRLVSPFLRKQL